jgi:hypothetical protein
MSRQIDLAAVKGASYGFKYRIKRCLLFFHLFLLQTVRIRCTQQCICYLLPVIIFFDCVPNGVISS